MATTSARMRQAFKYPDEDDVDDRETAEGMDEEEQEQLIQQLASNDASATQIYKSFFMIIPIVASLVFLQPLIRPTDSSAFFQAIMSLTSLAATGYILYYKPLGPKAKTPAGRSLGKDQIQQLDQAHAGPIDKYIVYLNLGLAGVLALSGYAGKVATGDPTRLSLGMIPGLVFLAIMGVRSQLKLIDFGELEDLKYDYKGA